MGYLSKEIKWLTLAESDLTYNMLAQNLFLTDSEQTAHVNEVQRVDCLRSNERPLSSYFNNFLYLE